MPLAFPVDPGQQEAVFFRQKHNILCEVHSVMYLFLLN